MKLGIQTFGKMGRVTVHCWCKVQFELVRNDLSEMTVKQTTEYTECTSAGPRILSIQTNPLPDFSLPLLYVVHKNTIYM